MTDPLSERSYAVRYWFQGDLHFASLGEFGALAWGPAFPLRPVPFIPRRAR